MRTAVEVKGVSGVMKRKFPVSRGAGDTILPLTNVPRPTPACHVRIFWRHKGGGDGVSWLARGTRFGWKNGGRRRAPRLLEGKTIGSFTYDGGGPAISFPTCGPTVQDPANGANGRWIADMYEAADLLPVELTCLLWNREHGSFSLAVDGPHFIDDELVWAHPVSEGQQRAACIGPDRRTAPCQSTL